MDLLANCPPTTDLSPVSLIQVIVVGEHKTLATFAGPGNNSAAQLIVAYNTPGRMGGHSAVKKVIGQAMRYMAINYCRYGFITTYDAVYFLRWPTRSHLEISEPVSLQQQSPTLLKCFYYVLRAALLPDPPPLPSLAIAVQDTQGASTSGDVDETKRKTRSAAQRERSNKGKASAQSSHIMEIKDPKLEELLEIWQFGDAPDNARKLLKRATSEHRIPSSVATEMSENLTVIDPSGLCIGRWVSGEKNAFFVKLTEMTGIYKRSFNKESNELLFREISVYLKLGPLQGDKIPRLLLSGVVQGYGAPELFMITKHYGESHEPHPDDVPELEEILKDVHSHGILLGGPAQVTRFEGRLMLTDMSRAVFEKRKTLHRQELLAILGSIN